MDVIIIIITPRDHYRSPDLSPADERPGCLERSQDLLHECNDDDAAGGIGDRQRERLTNERESASCMDPHSNFYAVADVQQHFLLRQRQENGIDENLRVSTCGMELPMVCSKSVFIANTVWRVAHRSTELWSTQRLVWWLDGVGKWVSINIDNPKKPLPLYRINNLNRILFASVIIPAREKLTDAWGRQSG